MEHSYTLIQYRCERCRRLLFKGEVKTAVIEIMCWGHHCKHINKILKVYEESVKTIAMTVDKSLKLSEE